MTHASVNSFLDKHVFGDCLIFMFTVISSDRVESNDVEVLETFHCVCASALTWHNANDISWYRPQLLLGINPSIPCIMRSNKSIDDHALDFVTLLGFEDELALSYHELVQFSITERTPRHAWVESRVTEEDKKMIIST